jgi:hypothetical protein
VFESDGPIGQLDREEGTTRPFQFETVPPPSRCGS